MSAVSLRNAIRERNGSAANATAVLAALDELIEATPPEVRPSLMIQLAAKWRSARGRG